MKKCKLCKEDKCESEYYDKRRTWCKTCSREYRNTKGRNKQLLERYGINIKEYNDMLVKQNYCCAICNKHISELSVNLAVDHCHTSMKIRGLLCFNCNSGLGRFKDNTEFLLKAVTYLMPQETENILTTVVPNTPETG